MIHRIKNIGPLQLGKVFGICYALMALLITPIVLLLMAVAGFATRANGGMGPPPLAFLGLGVGFLIFAPLFYAIMGFLFGVLGAFVYNLESH